MIRYALKCDRDHRFESWFQSAAAYDDLKARSLIACAVCQSAAVEKDLMAPAVAEKPARPLSAPANVAEQALAELRRKVEDRAEYVGPSFATETRAIHDGTAPDRPIWGEARADEARRLVEDGLPVAPLPFRPKGRAN